MENPRKNPLHFFSARGSRGSGHVPLRALVGPLRCAVSRRRCRGRRRGRPPVVAGPLAVTAPTGSRVAAGLAWGFHGDFMGILMENCWEIGWKMMGQFGVWQWFH